MSPLERALRETEAENELFQQEQRDYRTGREDNPIAWMMYACGRTDDAPHDGPIPLGGLSVDGQEVDLRRVYRRPPY